MIYYTSLIELVHIVDIEAPSESPFAGSNYSFVCTVTSDFPSSVKWLDPDGNEVDGSDTSITTSQPVVNGNTTTLVLNFDPLKTSHSGIYSCTSFIMPNLLKIETRELAVRSKLIITSV